ncbi:hypothetical protein ACQJBY_028644 [Aegilops geniculata]
MGSSVWDTQPPKHSIHSLLRLYHSKPHLRLYFYFPVPSFLLDTNPSSSPDRPTSGASELHHARSDESSRRRLAGLGAAIAPPERGRLVRCAVPKPALLIPRHRPAVPSQETGPPLAAATQLPGGGAGGGDEAGDPVHPGHGRADDPGRAADQVPRRLQRGGHLRVRPAVGVRLVGGARGHHGVLHDRRGGRAADGGRERQVRQREAGQGGGQVRDAHGRGLGPLHEVHGEVLAGQRPPVRQELSHISSMCLVCCPCSVQYNCRAGNEGE